MFPNCSCHVFRPKLWGSRWPCIHRTCGWCAPPSSHQHPTWRPFPSQRPAVRRTQRSWKKNVSTHQRYERVWKTLSSQFGWDLSLVPKCCTWALVTFVISSNHSGVSFLAETWEKYLGRTWLSLLSFRSCCITCQTFCVLSKSFFLFP